MNKKELGEIKKQLKFDNDKLLLKGIQEAYGKNRDGEASIQFTRLINPDTLEKEEGELYFDIFKKSLGGTPGKNLLEYGFDASDPQAKELQQRFYDYKNGSLLKEDEFKALAVELLKKGDYRNNVYITAGIFEYAAPGLNANNEVLEENSIFRFMIVAVTEARLTDIGLYYSTATNEVARKVNDEMQIIPAPLDAIFYPSFSSRASDVNHFLYHCKAAKSPNIELIEEFFHIPFVSSAPEQSEGFAKVISEVFPQGMEASTAMKFHENISDYVSENSQEDSVVMLDKPRIKDLLLASGANSENMQHFDSAYSKILEDQEVAAVNLMEKGKISLKAPSISISVKDDALEQIRTETINGKRCLVIEMDEGLEISGLPSNLQSPKKSVNVIHAAPEQTASHVSSAPAAPADSGFATASSSFDSVSSQGANVSESWSDASPSPAETASMTDEENRPETESFSSPVQDSPQTDASDSMVDGDHFDDLDIIDFNRQPEL